MIPFPFDEDHRTGTVVAMTGGATNPFEDLDANNCYAVMRDMLQEAVAAIESGRCEADSPYLTLAVRLIEDVRDAL